MALSATTVSRFSWRRTPSVREPEPLVHGPQQGWQDGDVAKAHQEAPLHLAGLQSALGTWEWGEATGQSWTGQDGQRGRDGAPLPHPTSPECLPWGSLAVSSLTS